MKKKEHFVLCLLCALTVLVIRGRMPLAENRASVNSFAERHGYFALAAIMWHCDVAEKNLSRPFCNYRFYFDPQQNTVTFDRGSNIRHRNTGYTSYAVVTRGVINAIDVKALKMFVQVMLFRLAFVVPANDWVFENIAGLVRFDWHESWKTKIEGRNTTMVTYFTTSLRFADSYPVVLATQN